MGRVNAPHSSLLPAEEFAHQSHARRSVSRIKYGATGNIVERCAGKRQSRHEHRACGPDTLEQRQINVRGFSRKTCKAIEGTMHEKDAAWPDTHLPKSCDKI